MSTKLVLLGAALVCMVGFWACIDLVKILPKHTPFSLDQSWWAGIGAMVCCILATTLIRDALK